MSEPLFFFNSPDLNPLLRARNPINTDGSIYPLISLVEFGECNREAAAKRGKGRMRVDQGEPSKVKEAVKTHQTSNSSAIEGWQQSEK